MKKPWLNACFISLIITFIPVHVFAKDITAGDLKGEWKNGAEFVTIEVIDSQPSIVSKKRKYAGSLFSKQGFYVTWKPKNIEEFNSPEIPNDIRSQLISLGYEQKGYVYIINKRSLRMELFMDSSKYIVDRYGHVEKRTVESVYRSPEVKKFNLTRDGYQITSLDVKDSLAPTNDKRKEELKEKIREAEAALQKAVQEEMALGKQYDEQHQQVFEMNNALNRISNSIHQKVQQALADHSPPAEKTGPKTADAGGISHDDGIAKAPSYMPDAQKVAELQTLHDKYQAKEAEISAGVKELHALEEKHTNAQLVTFEKMDVFLDLKEEYDKLTQCFIKRVDGLVDNKKVFSAEFESPADLKDFIGLNEMIEEQKAIINMLIPTRQAALKEHDLLTREAAQAGYRLSEAQWNAALGRAGLSLASDSYDIAKRAAETGPVGAALELARKVGEKSAFNLIDKGTISPTTQDLGLSSDVEKAVIKDLNAAYSSETEAEVQKAHDALKAMEVKKFVGDMQPGYKPGSVVPGLNADGDLLKNNVIKRTLKDGVSRNIRDIFTSVQFNGIKGEKDFKRWNDVLTLKKWIKPDSMAGKILNADVGKASVVTSKIPFLQSGYDMGKLGKAPGFLPQQAKGLNDQLNKLRNPSAYDRSKLNDSIFKDLVTTLGKVGIDQAEIRVLRDYTIKDILARRAYAIYRVASDRTYEAENTLQQYMNQKNDFLKKATEDKKFNRAISEEFDEDDVVEFQVTLQKADDKPEESLVLNTTPTKGGAKHQYFVKVDKNVGQPKPKDMTISIKR